VKPTIVTLQDGSRREIQAHAYSASSEADVSPEKRSALRCYSVKSYDDPPRVELVPESEVERLIGRNQFERLS
jgi:hypothetical protein